MTSDATLGELLKIGQSKLGQGTIIEFDREIVTALHCGSCGSDEKVFRVLGKVTTHEAICPKCGAERVPEMTHSVTAGDDYLNLSLQEVGLPPYDIVIARAGLDIIYFEISGDQIATPAKFA